MPSSCTVIIPICGDLDMWRPLAARAAASVDRQTVATTRLIIEADTVASARNQGADVADSDHLIFLDADDELDCRYVESMLAAVQPGDVLYQPSTQGVINGKLDPAPWMIPPKADLLEGNWMVCGTMVRREQFLRVGGFRELPAWEDWDLWLRCWRDGVSFVQVPDAIYRVHVRPGSRNDLQRRIALRLYKEIRSEYEPAQ